MSTQAQQATQPQEAGFMNREEAIARYIAKRPDSMCCVDQGQHFCFHTYTTSIIVIAKVKSAEVTCVIPFPKGNPIPNENIPGIFGGVMDAAHEKVREVALKALQPKSTEVH